MVLVHQLSRPPPATYFLQFVGALQERLIIDPIRKLNGAVVRHENLWFDSVDCCLCGTMALSPCQRTASCNIPQCLPTPSMWEC